MNYTASTKALRAPFPWFGGKSRAAPLVWAELGAGVTNYVEPFAGSLATLLGRPNGPGHTETVNDLDAYLANFWRAVSADPDLVAHYADWPVNENDLHARHQWLVNRCEFRERVTVDPEFYDAKIAGWWVWGICQWIGTGWCDISRQLPHAGDAGMGVHRQLPHAGNAGRGVHRQLPHAGNAGMGEDVVAVGPLADWFHALSARMRRVRVACGDWSRVLTESVTTRHGMTGVLLDPPYAEGNQDYAVGGTGTDISAAVRQWAIDNGDNPLLRVVLCGYEGEHEMPSGWRKVEWKAMGGYAKDMTNSRRERLWCSPHCLGQKQRGLFEGVT
jgi:site-specific DNA-adenine methylase